MKMLHVYRSLTFAAIVAAASPALAAEYSFDGQLPMYPHGQLDAKESSLTPAAIAHGVPLVLLTSDGLDVVDAWYGGHLPKACTRQQAASGLKYACPGGSVMVYLHAGKTQIALIPPMPGMNLH